MELLCEKLQGAELELARWKVEKLTGKLPDLTGASRIADTVLVLPSTRTPTCKSEVVDNIGLQSHGSAARFFRSNGIITAIYHRTVTWSKSIYECSRHRSNMGN